MGAYLKEGDGVGLLENFDAELDEARRLSELPRAPPDLLPQRRLLEGDGERDG